MDTEEISQYKIKLLKAQIYTKDKLFTYSSIMSYGLLATVVGGMVESQKICIPGTCKCDLTWKLYRCNSRP